ncbi:MAG TPA: hypothetical protein VND22_06325 [Actinomycetota bacterium]|nr:hypothetical protein [Actinomycetota bacterium]
MTTLAQPALRRPKAPGYMYAGIATASIVLIGILALTATSPPPPTIAEFAPQANRIEDAPDEQTSEFGEGSGNCPPGSTTCDPAGTDKAAGGEEPDPIDIPRVRKCIGDPPRQTEDPQSPPCVPYFKGDNGGETYKGVTADEVRIAAPSNTTFADGMVAYFNSRYEFYGRKMVIVPGIGAGFGPDAAKMSADAVKADEELKVFGSLLYGDGGGEEFVYYDELARRGIVSVDARPTMNSEASMKKFHPYQWGYLPGFDLMSRAMSEWICKALAGKSADYSGADVITERKFGMVTTVRASGARPDVTAQKRILADCGVQLAVERDQVMDGNDQSGFQQAQSILTEMQTNRVTTIICNCHTQTSGYYMSSLATKQGYFPEWLISTYMYQAEDTHAQVWDSGQVAHSFGLGWWDKQLPPQDEVWYRAVKEGGRNFNNEFDYYEARWLFNSIRMMAAGLQMAGPKLTPESFADGLMKSRFPNPNAGGPPDYQASIRFGPDDHTAIDDAAIVWLSKTEQSNWSGRAGAVCYAQNGKRYKLGQFPSDYGGIFQRPCY